MIANSFNVKSFSKHLKTILNQVCYDAKYARL